MRSLLIANHEGGNEGQGFIVEVGAWILTLAFIPTAIWMLGNIVLSPVAFTGWALRTDHDGPRGWMDRWFEFGFNVWERSPGVVQWFFALALLLETTALFGLVVALVFAAAGYGDARDVLGDLL